MRFLTHGSLFSGIGGFDLAAQWMGWENIFHCEWKEFNQKVLKYYWPNATSYSDITKTDFSIHRGTIDILTGGFPCQPYSVAGKRKGKEDERHLWPEMLRAVREIQPPWIVGENVRGLINWTGGLVFEEVQADLEAEGYEVQPFLLPASGVNAPHERYRIWFVAYSNEIRGRGRRTDCDRKEKKTSFGENLFISSNRSCTQCTYSDSTNAGFESLRCGRENEVYGLEASADASCRNGWDIRRYETCDRRETTQQPQYCNNGRNGHASDTNGLRLRTKIDRVRESRFINQAGPADNWENFPTQSPICNGNDGLSSRLDSITFSKWRSESIMGGGNAIVPQVALQIFKAIEQYDQLI